MNICIVYHSSSYMTINHLVFICCVWYFFKFAGHCGRIGNSSKVGHFAFMHNNDIAISLNFRIQFSTILDIESFSKWFLIENYTAATSTLLYMSQTCKLCIPILLFLYPVVKFDFISICLPPTQTFSSTIFACLGDVWESSLQIKPTHIDAPSDTGPYILRY